MKYYKEQHVRQSYYYYFYKVVSNEKFYFWDVNKWTEVKGVGNWDSWMCSNKQDWMYKEIKPQELFVELL